jgi:hypothetical protein
MAGGGKCGRGLYWSGEPTHDLSTRLAGLALRARRPRDRQWALPHDTNGDEIILHEAFGARLLCLPLLLVLGTALVGLRSSPMPVGGFVLIACGAARRGVEADREAGHVDCERAHVALPTWDANPFVLIPMRLGARGGNSGAVLAGEDAHKL